jgi:ribosomal protein L7/L12
MNNYFICVQYRYHDSDEIFLASDLITADSRNEALGKALEQQDHLSGKTFVLKYNIMKTDLVKVDNMEGYQWDSAESSWKALIHMSHLTIMRGVDEFLGMGQKIQAIKHLREYLKPYVGLKGCKLIVEERDRQIAQNPLIRTALPNLIERFKTLGIP